MRTEPGELLRGEYPVPLVVLHLKPDGGRRIDREDATTQDQQLLHRYVEHMPQTGQLPVDACSRDRLPLRGERGSAPISVLLNHGGRDLILAVGAVVHA